MNRFLVQVNKDGGYANITNNKRYQNHLWHQKPRDAQYGEVKIGDELVIYCTGSVPDHGKSIPFSAVVLAVSDDNITFEIGNLCWFPAPLGLQSVNDLVSQQKLPELFRKCGQQGFNIAKIDPASGELLMSLVGVREPVTPTIYTTADIIDDGCFLDRAMLESILQRLETKQNIILQGPPGTGKTWLAKKLAYALIGSKDDGKIRPLQFHPNLSYEDFVRGWRPQGDGNLSLVDGPFIELAEEARQHSDSRYVAVIEEINRGNPASIFGEMLTLLEADKRTPDEALALAYPRADGERFHLPSNLYVIGTMNVADRSLAMVDLALRRRFAFFDLEPIFNDVWRDWVSDQSGIPTEFLEGVAQRMNALNQRIATDANLGRQFLVGHSYVTPSPGTPTGDPGEWFVQVVESEIAPLLREYWFDNPDAADQAVSQLLNDL